MADPEKLRGPIAIDSIPWSEDGQGERFAMRYRVLSDTRKDGRKIGIAYEEPPPRKQSIPTRCWCASSIARSSATASGSTTGTVNTPTSR